MRTFILILWYTLCGLLGYHFAHYFIIKSVKRREEKIRKFVETLCSDKFPNTEFQEHLIKLIIKDRW